MFGPRTQRFFRALAEWWVRPFAALGVTPNMLTVAGLVLASASAAAIAMDHMVWAAVLLFIGGAFDLSDGALARVQNSRSTFGAFFDSTLDRYSESVVLFGLVYHYGQRGQTLELGVVFAALVGSLMVSYTRARAEGLGFECKEGFYARPERVMTLVVGFLLYPWLFWFVVALAVLSNLTAIQRMRHVWRLTRPNRTQHSEHRTPHEDTPQGVELKPQPRPAENPTG
jgi:CDP-diacylglycerol--glycerol-3-phosphate 3-phosphatidyltransferase